jgi:hypothetical protein
MRASEVVGLSTFGVSLSTVLGLNPQPDFSNWLKAQENKQVALWTFQK